VTTLRWCALAAFAALLATGVSAAAGTESRADPAFAQAAVVPGQRACAAATADFNGDARADLAVAACKSKTVDLLLGDGAGGFRRAGGPPIAVGEEVVSVLATDLNRDARPDLAVLGRSELRLLLGNGAGSFAAAPGSPVRLAETAAALAAADVNRDGRVDLAVARYQGRHAQLVVLRGDGSGGFTRAPRPAVIGKNWPSAPIAGDFNGDGLQDLAVGHSEFRTTLMLGDGAGGFRAARTLRAGLLAVGDFSGDGRPDLAGVTESRGGLLVGILTGSAFRPASRIPVAGSRPEGTVVDLDGDRRLDLVLGNEYGITVLLGNGKGKLRLATDSPFALSGPPFFRAPWPSGLLVADFNGDGKPDLAAKGGRSGPIVLWQTPSAPPVAAGGPLPGRRALVVSTRGRISALAVDGKRVAVSTAGKGFCGRVVVWPALGGRAKAFRTGEGCESGTIPYHVVELALGGGQVAWIGAAGGNSLDMLLHEAKLSSGRKRQLEWANNASGAAGQPTGDWVGQLMGEGPLLVYNRWSVVCNPPPDSGCEWSDPTVRLVKQRLYRLVAGRRIAVKRGSDSYPVSAVGGGRMAVQTAGAVAVLAPSGGRVAAVPTNQGNPPRAIALSRTRLAVQRTLELDLHDPASGKKSLSIPLGSAAGLRLVGVSSKLALLRGPRRLVLVRLSDGKLVSLSYRQGAAAAVTAVRLNEAGLFYAYNTRTRAAKKGRIVFEATRHLLARF
jgi:FG-GAP-like repeat